MVSRDVGDRLDDRRQRRVFAETQSASTAWAGADYLQRMGGRLAEPRELTVRADDSRSPHRHTPLKRGGLPTVETRLSPQDRANPRVAR